MKKSVIFSDIDGVLNSVQSFRRNNADRLFYGKLAPLCIDLSVSWHMSYLDFEKVMLLKMLAERTDSEIVIVSAWKNLLEWPLIEERLVSIGLPIAGTIGNVLCRGEEIVGYVKEHQVKNYIVLDDDRFPEYRDLEEEIMNHLLKCDMYNEGLTEEIVDEAIKFLGEKDQEKRLCFE